MSRIFDAFDNFLKQPSSEGWNGSLERHISHEDFPGIKIGTVDCEVILPAKAIKESKIMPMLQLLGRKIEHCWHQKDPSQQAREAPRKAYIGNSRNGQNASEVRAQIEGQTWVKPAHVTPVSTGDKGDTAISTDWKFMKTISRTSAFTFRGDGRAPKELLVKHNGFHPPSTRTDDYYLETNIYPKFDDYLQRRFKRSISKEDFLKCAKKAAPTDEDKHMLADYTLYAMWRKLMKQEELHLGRMTVEELLKGYISTSRSLAIASCFATGRNGTRDGWIYVTRVKHGWVIPSMFSTVEQESNHVYNTHEQEIAQLGPIVAKEIVAFRHVAKPITGSGPFVLDGPIYVRSDFRKGEVNAYEKIMDILKGKVVQPGCDG